MSKVPSGEIPRTFEAALKERAIWIANAQELQKQVNGWEPERQKLKSLLRQFVQFTETCIELEKGYLILQEHGEAGFQHSALEKQPIMVEAKDLIAQAQALL